MQVGGVSASRKRFFREPGPSLGAGGRDRLGAHPYADVDGDRPSVVLTPPSRAPGRRRVGPAARSLSYLPAPRAANPDPAFVDP